MRPVDHEYWESVHNTHLGERAFILASGPSLADSDLSLLDGEFIVGVSQLATWDGVKDVQFSAWASAEHRDMSLILPQVARLNIPKWLGNGQWYRFNPTEPELLMEDHPDWHWIHTDHSISWHGRASQWAGVPDALGLGEDFWRTGIAFSPVAQPAIPALAWMGFRRIYLLGVDHTASRHVYDEAEERHQDVRRANKAYANLIPEIESRGVTVRNCSPDSLAPVPYLSYAEALANG